MKNVKFFFCLIFSVISFGTFSQSQPEHKQGFYLSEDGKLFWKGGKPVYLFVSENPDGSNATRLNSEKTSEYANPMYLDTEGVNFIRSQWAVDKDGNYAEPRQEVMFEVYNDGIAPRSTISLSGSPRFIRKGNVFYGKSLQLTINSKDGVSGVRSIMQSEGNSQYAEFNGTISPSQDRSYAYSYYAIDNVGNKEEPNSIEFTVDVTSPSTTHSIAGDNLNDMLSPRSKIELNTSDNSSGVKSTYYKIDDGAFKMYTRSISLAKLEEGPHSITYYSLDNVDNTENQIVYAFYLDRTAPEVVASVEGDQYETEGKIYASSRTRIRLESNDNKSGVKEVLYNINGKDETVYSGPFELPQESGQKKILFYGSDKVENSFKTLYDQSSLKNKAISVDITAPEIGFSFKGDKCISRDTTFISSKTLISLVATDTESGVKSISYKINGGVERMYNEPFSVKDEGYYEIEFFGLDQVNNKESATFSFINDNTGPVIETILSMEPVGSISLDEVQSSLAVYSSGVKLYLGATDGVVDTEFIYYSINDAKEILYTKPVNLGGSGVTSLRVRALDKLGNETEMDPSKIFIK